jgi:DNA mismatch endonuclease, patch repair protein
MDVVSVRKRSQMMAGIRGKNTLPEREVRKLLHDLGFRFRLHRKDLPGCPDIVLPKWRLAIFVHGCFWHQHSGCRYAVMPKSNHQFWSTKLGANVERDERILTALRGAGWRTLIVWECAFKQPSERNRMRKRLRHITESCVQVTSIP